MYHESAYLQLLYNTFTDPRTSQIQPFRAHEGEDEDELVTLKYHSRDYIGHLEVVTLSPTKPNRFLVGSVSYMHYYLQSVVILTGERRNFLIPGDPKIGSLKR